MTAVKVRAERRWGDAIRDQPGLVFNILGRVLTVGHAGDATKLAAALNEEGLERVHRHGTELLPRTSRAADSCRGV